MMVWTLADLPSLSGKTALVTGATGGLGLEAATALASAGAKVHLGGRNEEKGRAAIEKIKAKFPQADVSFALINHGNLQTVREFAEKFNALGQPLHILINNAGVMAPPTRQETKDSFELQLGTNHLAHFALTGLLLPSLKLANKDPSSPPEPARVINVSSVLAHYGDMNIKDLNSLQSYSPFGVYQQSKLANLLFHFELQRRSDSAHWGVEAIAAHPGLARTELVANGPRDFSISGILLNYLFKPFLSNSQEEGTLPILFAATAKEVEKGGYYGPQGFREMYGPVGPARVPEKAKNETFAVKLWEESERLTGVKFE